MADTVVAGLGTMIGAGLFAGLAPASAVAGRWLLVGMVIAAVLALLTCFSIGDQARAFPGSGGDYRYTREQLGRWPGRTAGGLCLVGRAASAAALAGCFGSYVSPSHPVPPALALLVAVVVADAFAVRPSRMVTRVLTVFVLAVLAVVVAACFAIAPPPPVGVPLPVGIAGLDHFGGVLPAAGVLFFAFLGFEQVGQVTSAARRPRAVVPVLLAVALGTYLLVSWAVLRQLGPTLLAVSAAPLRDALDAADAGMLDPAVTLAATVATATGLLLVVGVGRRTADVMAAKGDLPARGMAVRLLIGGGAAVGVLFAGPGPAIELAATCALFYHAFSNASARLLPKDERTWPPRTACFGMAIAVLVGMSMPAVDLLIVLAVAVVAALMDPLVRLGQAVRR